MMFIIIYTFAQFIFPQSSFLRNYKWSGMLTKQINNRPVHIEENVVMKRHVGQAFERAICQEEDECIWKRGLKIDECLWRHRAGRNHLSSLRREDRQKQEVCSCSTEWKELCLQNICVSIEPHVNVWCECVHMLFFFHCLCSWLNALRELKYKRLSASRSKQLMWKKQATCLHFLMDCQEHETCAATMLMSNNDSKPSCSENMEQISNALV